MLMDNITLWRIQIRKSQDLIKKVSSHTIGEFLFLPLGHDERGSAIFFMRDFFSSIGDWKEKHFFIWLILRLKLKIVFAESSKVYNYHE